MSDVLIPLLFDDHLAWHLARDCNCPPPNTKCHPTLITHEADVAFLTVINLRVVGVDSGYVQFEQGRVIYIAGDVGSLNPVTFYVFEHIVPRSSSEVVIR